ncbi:MAG: NAD-dependent epimerase/dehydratase family protein [Pacificimonas sp.]
MAMKLLLLGGSGFVGPAIAAAAKAAGDDVIVAARSPADDADRIVLDRTDPAAVRAIVDGQDVDVVIDILAMTVAATAPLIAELANVNARYIMLSSADVYRNYGGLHGKSDVPPDPVPLAEDAPFRSNLYPYRGAALRSPRADESWQDDYEKIEVEAAVRASLPMATILRLPMVFGPRDPSRRFRWCLEPMLRGAPALTVDRAWADWRTSYAHVDNVGGAIVAAAHEPATSGRTFNLGNDLQLTQLDWAARLAAELDWRGSIEAAPRSGTTTPPADRIASLDLAYDLFTDDASFRQTTGYEDCLTFDETLGSVIAEERRLIAAKDKTA